MNHRAGELWMLCLVLATLGRAQSEEHPQAPVHAPAAQHKGGEAAHHACLDEERAALERGEGFGMALPADHHAYPGPKHVLDLKVELKLTPEQQAAIEELFKHMKQQAVARGKEVLLAEQRLDEMFAEGRPEAELREQTFRAASLRGELRWVHLSAHVAARKLLTAEQLARYQRLRHSPPS